MQSRYEIPRVYSLEELPEYQRFQQANPGHQLDARQTIIMFGRAIHWLSIFEVIWPNFEEKDYFSVEVAYIVHNDPDKDCFPPLLYEQIASMISSFWSMQLTSLYPNGDWTVNIRPDEEMTVEASIRSRK